MCEQMAGPDSSLSLTSSDCIQPASQSLSPTVPPQFSCRRQTLSSKNSTRARKRHNFLQRPNLGRVLFASVRAQSVHSIHPCDQLRGFSVHAVDEGSQACLNRFEGVQWDGGVLSRGLLISREVFQTWHVHLVRHLLRQREESLKLMYLRYYAKFTNDIVTHIRFSRPHFHLPLCCCTTCRGQRG